MPLESIESVRKLSLEEASAGQSVDVTAQVVWTHANGSGLFLNDGEDGVFVQAVPDVSTFSLVKLGDVIRVQGKTLSGGFSTAVEAYQVDVVEHRPLPEGRPFRIYERDLVQIDCDWVYMSGRVISMRVVQEVYKDILLEVDIAGAIVHVQIPYTDVGAKAVQDIMFQRVRYHAVAGTVFNEHRQMAGRVFYVSSVDDLELIDSWADRTDAPLLELHELMRVDSADVRYPVRTHGVVMVAEGRELFLRGNESCLKVVAWSTIEGIRPGDEVELEGFVWPQPLSPAFRARSISLIDQTEAPKPVPVSLEERISSRLNNELIEVDAHVVDVGKSFRSMPFGDVGERIILLCRSGEQTFEAVLPQGTLLDQDISVGAQIQLQGICHLFRNEREGIGLFSHSFWLQVRAGSGIQVLQSAPWWTAGRVFGLVGIVLGLAVLFLIWIVMLRKTVDRQTDIIGEQIERKSILEERQRIARELHDNLEQGLAGLAIQLRNCQKRINLNESELKEASESGGQEETIEKGAEKSRRTIGVAQSILEHCMAESRSSILDLRGGVLERMDLFSAFREHMVPLAQECDAELRLELEGDPVRLDRMVERNLLLVAKEAVTNAVRHGNPKHLKVRLSYGVDDVTLSIEDDGCGFDLDALPNTGRFGLQGMQERVNKLSGDIQVESSPGLGTTVMVSVGIHDGQNGQNGLNG